MANKTYCYVDQDFKNNGSGEGVFLALIRQRGTRPLEVGSFLLHLGCTGVKDAFYTQIEQEQLEDFKADAFKRGYREEAAAWGRKLIEETLAYAQSLGLKPHRDYKKAARVFGGVRATDCDILFRFGGEDGKPLYFQGKDSDETARRMVDHLNRKLGADGFHFIVEASTALSESVEERIDYYMQEAEAGRRKKAQKGIAELVEEYPEHAEIHFAQGVLRINEDDIEAALESFNQAVAMDPEMEEAWMNKAAAHKEMYQAYETIIALRKVCELTSPDDELHQNAKEALDSFAEGLLNSQGVSIDDFLLAEGLFKQAREHLQNKEYEKAISIMEANPERLPVNETSLTLKGECHRRLEQWDLARDCLERALDIEPDCYPARIQLALLRMEKDGDAFDEKLNEMLQYPELSSKVES